MSSYITIHNDVDSKLWWNDLIRACAVMGETFEIHCWSDEKVETELALDFGKRASSTWQGGTVIRGTITKEFLTFLTKMPKPEDTFVYNKMTPFFTIVLGNRLHSEHYGTEIILSRVDKASQPTIDRILKDLAPMASIHRNLG